MNAWKTWAAWNRAYHLVGSRWVRVCDVVALSASQGKLTAQGKLLQQDTFYVTEQDSGVQSRPKERRVFLFEQIVIFSELLRKGSLTPGYMFKKSIKVRNAEGEAYSVWRSCEVHPVIGDSNVQKTFAFTFQWIRSCLRSSLNINHGVSKFIE